jgi:hypothetical protein
MNPNGGVERWGGGCGVSANEYSCAHGAQINFVDLTPYLTYVPDNAIATCGHGTPPPAHPEPASKLFGQTAILLIRKPRVLIPWVEKGFVKWLHKGSWMKEEVLYIGDPNIITPGVTLSACLCQ